MSFTLVEQAPPRLNRSELAVPGSQPKLFEKAAKGAADVIFLDLEDAVAPDDKVQARKNIIEALRDIDWGSKTMSVRINGLDTHYMYRDVVDVVEQAGDKLDLIMIPKVGTAADVYAVDMMVTQIEAAKGANRPSQDSQPNPPARRVSPPCSPSFTPLFAQLHIDSRDALGHLTPRSPLRIGFRPHELQDRRASAGPSQPQRAGRPRQSATAL